MDWSAARREVANIEKLGDRDLDKLYDDIVSSINSLDVDITDGLTRSTIGQSADIARTTG